MQCNLTHNPGMVFILCEHSTLVGGIVTFGAENYAGGIDIHWSHAQTNINFSLGMRPPYTPPYFGL